MNGFLAQKIDKNILKPLLMEVFEAWSKVREILYSKKNLRTNTDLPPNRFRSLTSRAQAQQRNIDAILDNSVGSIKNAKIVIKYWNKFQGKSS